MLLIGLLGCGAPCRAASIGSAGIWGSFIAEGKLRGCYRSSRSFEGASLLHWAQVRARACSQALPDVLSQRGAGTVARQTDAACPAGRALNVIEGILPATVAAEEVTSAVPGAVLFPEDFPEEAVAVARAVDQRREEFTTARECARRALARLGVAPQPIVNGEHGEPRWPASVVGSITHCEGYRACAVARKADMRAVGIDAEPDQPLPDGVLGEVAFGEELAMLRRLGGIARDVCWDRLLFSAKESVYKAWFPLARCWLGFEDVSLSIDPVGETYAAMLLVPGPILADGELRGFAGRWMVQRGLVLTASSRRPGSTRTRWP